MRKEVKRIQHQLRQLDKMEERAKQKVPKTKKEKFSAMHVRPTFHHCIDSYLVSLGDL